MTQALKPSHSKQQGNILLVANYPSDIGYAWWLMENFWAEIAGHFANQGRESFLIYPKIANIPQRILDAPIQVHELNYRDRTLENIEKLKVFIQKHNIDIVYLTDKAYYDTLYFKLRSWGVKKIINHDHTPGERPPAKPVIGFLKRMLHHTGIISCDHYIGVSKFVQDRLISSSCIPKNKTSYVLNGITPIQLDKAYQYHAHQQFDIPQQAVIVITTGRATFHKGIDFIIECANSLINKKHCDNVYFIHCGDGPDLPAFKDMVKEYKLEKQFIFAGQRQDVRCLLQSCDIGIQASAGEAFSLSILEYLSAGLATLVPAVCGNGEAVADGVSGYLYPGKDLDFVVEKLFTLVHNPDLRQSLGQRALASVHEQFTITRANHELVQLLDEIINSDH